MKSEIVGRALRWLRRFWYSLSGAEAARVRYWAERALDKRWAPSTDPNSLGLFYPKPPTLEESREAYARLKALQGVATATGMSAAEFAATAGSLRTRAKLELEEGLEAVHDPATGSVLVRRERAQQSESKGE